MSHEMVRTDQRLVYVMPAWPSDVLRTRKFDQFFERYRGASFSVRTVGGWQWFSSPMRGPVFTASFASRKQLDAVIDESSENALAKAFLSRDLEVQGDLATLMSVAEYALRHSGGLNGGLMQVLSRIIPGCRKVLKANGANQGRILHCPLDLPVQFFQSWLGPSLAHSCACFRSSEQDLEAAHHHGLARICERLGLSGGDRLLDMSCGWGNLLLYATSQHGALGQGITASEQQASFTQNRIQRDRMQRQCTVECCNIGSMPITNTFEKIVDVGLFNQVLVSHLPKYLNRTYRMLAPGGLLLLHRLTRSPRLQCNAAGTGEIETLNPGDLASLSDELQVAESAGFHLVSLEDLGVDFRQTLRLWIEQLQRGPQAHASLESRNHRIWLFHLLDTVTNLNAGNVQLHQIVLRRPPRSDTHKTHSFVC